MSLRRPRPKTHGEAPPKSVLICTSCGHESEITGDWVREEVATPVGRRIAYECPACRTTITHRPPADD